MRRRRISDIFCGYDNRSYNNNGPMGNKEYRPAERPETAEQQPEASKSLFGRCKDHVNNNKTAYGLAGAFLAGVAITIGAEKIHDHFRKDEESKPANEKKQDEDNKEDSAKKEEQFEEVK